MQAVIDLIERFEDSLAAYRRVLPYADAPQRRQLERHIKWDSEIVADLQERFLDA